jgi:hypothetical protein
VTRFSLPADDAASGLRVASLRRKLFRHRALSRQAWSSQADVAWSFNVSQSDDQQVGCHEASTQMVAIQAARQLPEQSTTLRVVIE